MIKFKQRGSVIIVVVMVLFIVASVGAVAARLSMVSTNLASNGIAKRLMQQEASTAMFYLKEYGVLTDKKKPEGVYGYALNLQNREAVFCYRGQNPNNFFSTSSVSVLYWPSGTSAPTNPNGKNGFCKSETSTPTYTSARNAVMTQISLRYTTETAAAFTGDSGATGSVMVAYVTSVMPNMVLSNVSGGNVDTCLSSKMSEPIAPVGTSGSASAMQSVTDCLEGINVPYVTLKSKFLIPS